MNNLLVFLKKRHYLVALIIYALITVVFSINVIASIDTEVPGQIDVYQVLARTNVLQNNIEGSNADINIIDKISFFLPFGIFKKTIHLYLFQEIFGQPLGYNLQWLLSFVLAAIGCYLLVYYLTKNKAGAFIAGLVYSFSPYHLSHAGGHLAAMNIEWLPFLVLFIYKFFDKKQFRYLLFSSIFFLLIVKYEDHYALYASIFIIILGIYLIKNNISLFKDKKFIVKLSLIILVGIILTTIIFFPMLKVSFSDDNFLAVEIEAAERFSMEIIGFILPINFHPIWGDYFYEKYASDFSGNRAENTNYIGVISLLLIIFAVISINKNKKVVFWLISGITFLILSLGPYLHFMGTLSTKIPLPYYLLFKYVPFFENIRATGRIFILSLLSFSVLVGYGMKYLLEKIKNIKYNRIIIVIIFLLIFIDFWYIPHTSAVAIPEFYKELINEKGDFSIIQIPGSTNYRFDARARYYNSITDKKFYGKFLSPRPEPGEGEFERNTTIINILLHVFPNERNLKSYLPKISNKKLNTGILNYYNIKYITIDKSSIGYRNEDINPMYYKKILKFVEKKLYTEKILDDNDMIVYKVQDKKFEKPFMNISKLEFQENSTGCKQIKSISGEIIKPEKYKKNISIAFRLKARKDPRKINVKINGESYSIKIKKEWEWKQFIITDFKKGSNEISIEFDDDELKSSSCDPIIISQIDVN